MGTAQPERVIKSDEFRSVVKAMFVADKLGTCSLIHGSDPHNLLLAARIVIDEAHCITQLGRDYRYFRLSVLQIPRV